MIVPDHLTGLAAPAPRADSRSSQGERQALFALADCVIGGAIGGFRFHTNVGGWVSGKRRSESNRSEGLSTELSALLRADFDDESESELGSKSVARALSDRQTPRRFPPAACR